MRYEEFIERVQRRLGSAEADAAGRAPTATLGTLGECLSGEEADDLAAQLPKELKMPLTRQSEDARPLSLEQFFQRVSEREGVGIDVARNHAAAVMKVLGEAASQGELRDVSSQLSPEVASLLAVRG